MIKINLLPFRAARKKENIRRQVSIFFLLIALVCVGLYAFTTQYLDKKIISTKEKITKVNKEIKLYKSKADRVKKIKADLATLKNKLKIVKSLKNRRKKPFELMDQMTQVVVKDRMWLTQMVSKPNNLILKGIAYDDPTIANFMDDIKKSPLFSSVRLGQSKAKSVKKIKLKAFDIVANKTKKKSNKKPESKKGKK